MPQTQSPALSQSQKNFRVAYLAVCFLTLFLSYSSLQNLFSMLCEEYGYKNLGQTAILFIYLAAFCSTPLTSVIIKQLGYKKTFFFCSLGYIVFDVSGVFMVFNNSQNQFLVKIMVCLGAFACGFSASVLWVAQGGYVSQIGNETNKSKLFAMFWSIIVSNQIIGNFIGAFILGKINTQVYFIVLSCLAVLSSIMFTFLPSVEVRKQGPGLSLKGQTQKIWKIIGNKKHKYLIVYFLFPGLSMAFYSGYLYKIIKTTILGQNQQSLEDYQKELNFSQGLVFIMLGVAQVITGYSFRKYLHTSNKFKLAIAGSIMVEIAGVISLLSYLQKSYYLCFLAAMFWGSCEIFNQTNTSVIVSILFEEKVQGFAVSRIFYCIGISLFLLANIVMSEVKIIVFLTLFLVLQTFGTVVSMNLSQLETCSESQYKSLQEQQKP